jgi:hypothetical protein
VADTNRTGAQIRAERHCQRIRHHARILAETGVTPAEEALFTVLYYGMTMEPASLPARAMLELYGNADPISEDDCRVALTNCLAKGQLQIVDEAFLETITAELREGGVLGPIYWMPKVGCVDFTPEGAELWQVLCNRQKSNQKPSKPYFPHYTDAVHIKSSRYFRTRSVAIAAIEESKGDEGATVSGPFPIGPWRVQWWRRFPEGYRINIEERMHWQGRCGGISESSFLSRSPRTHDPNPLLVILDRHHLSFAEWLFLSAMEWDYYRSYSQDLPRRMVEKANEEFDLTISEEECQRGMENCLRFELLRIVNQGAVDEVDTLLQNDPTCLAVPKLVKSTPGQIDFTPAGACLYRMIANEWLGPNWEDKLYVSNQFYSEVHYYSEAEEGFEHIFQFEIKKEDIRTMRIVPLGPWCVSWWKRFPSGYRLELEIGQP